MIVAGTGHRPGKAYPHGDDALWQLIHLAESALAEIKPTAVISGMALGFDTALAKASLRLGIPLWAYIPFVGQEGRWPTPSQVRYHLLLNQAERVRVVCRGGFSAEKMMARNRAMVDDSQLVLALYDGSNSGTGNAVVYAKGRGVPIRNLWSRWRSGE
jgi:uncharacterized phage-like protein YoqJ